MLEICYDEDYNLHEKEVGAYFMDNYVVKCLRNIDTEKMTEVAVPGSKSITNRALLLAAMADGTSSLNGCLTSDDARHFLTCLKELGFPVIEEADGVLGSNVKITGFGGKIPNKKAEIYVGSAGTAARFLVAMLAFSEGEYTVRSSEQMKKRPMQPLISVLRNAGATVKCLEEEGHFPLHIIGTNGVAPTEMTVNIDESSQFLSALLIAAGTLTEDICIHVVGSHGLSYVDLTAQMMKDFGVYADKREKDGQIFYILSGKEKFHPLQYDIEPDMSAAAYFYALGAIAGAKIKVKGVHNKMLQGDVAFLYLLEKMGCTVDGLHVSDKKDLLLKGTDRLSGNFTVDMSAFSDQALTLAAIAPFADGPITITGIGHIRLQECDRIHAIVHNLSALGLKVEEGEDYVTIFPGQMKGCELETYEDHRVAMAFALTGLKTDGVVIKNPMCCKKTFAQYFDVLEDTVRQMKK